MPPNPDGKASPDADPTASATSIPTTPRKVSPTQDSGHESTPVDSGASGSDPSTAPASAPAAARPRAATMRKPQDPPTLLADFLRGRPSPQRIAAQKQRQRRQSLDAVKAEMRQASVRKIQQPGGVRDRVKLWQKSNAALMAAGDPASTPSEPTDIASFSELSVTEEDRVRIKMRQRKKSVPKVEVTEDKDDVTGKGTEDGSKEPTSTEASSDNRSPSKGPPKRVVSDTNWIPKNKKKSPPRAAPKAAGNSASPGPGQALPKNFLQQPVVKQSTSNRIQDWAAKVEIPDSPRPRPGRHSRAKSTGDGIRTKAMAFEDIEKRASDDGIRVKPVRRRPLDDDGIRVRPTRSAPGHEKEEDDSEAIVVEEDESTRIEVEEDPDSCPDTPTRRPSRERLSRNRRKTPPKLRRNLPSDDKSWISTEDSAIRSELERSDLGSSVVTSAVGAKSLADIPVGFSAFSDLDLPAGSRGARPAMAQRKSSFKGMPSVLKKVMAESKKILSETSEPPRPAPTNKPPSIEKWLNGTVDPFVEKTDGSKSSEKKDSPNEKTLHEREGGSRRQSSSEHRRHKSSPPPRTELTEPTELSELTELTESTGLTGTTGFTESTGLTDSTMTTDTATYTDGDSSIVTPSPARQNDKQSDDSATPTSLKRRSATRASGSPLSKSARKPFKEVLKDAFRGESGTHIFTPKKYASYDRPPQQSQPEPESALGYDYDRYPDDDYSGVSGDTGLRSGSSDSWTDDPSSVADDGLPAMAGPRRKPPTNGVHELSTILGSIDESSSGQDSDLSSHVSDTTVTQSTALTRDTEVSRQRSYKSSGSLKRRLTKHSDLVSVLSLPDDSQVPGGVKNSRSRPSLRRNRSRTANGVSVDDLLQEFVDDENLYQRELKTLVDGVIPVLLTNVLNKGGKHTSASLFGSDPSGSKAHAMSKAVVNMGIALEKLKNAHRKASHTDIDRLITWMQTAVPIYHSYLDSWRLGFQDLVVNLLPAADKLDDEDSLIGALPRNAEGDVINENGERVDVAHLLKRPILRIRLLAKWAAGVHTLISSYDTLALSGDFSALQEKARRRQKEESARLADEDAANTDTSRTRDLRTLAPLSKVKIDPHKQVNAKDFFSLDLTHSNGQRLECQVELVHRDNPSKPSDRGDLLIREMGDGKRTWLLFPPAPWQAVSARKGGNDFEMVIMVQGTHNGKPWYELLTLSTNDGEQIEDWLDILGLSPVPPMEREPAPVDEPSPESPGQLQAMEVPVGGKLRSDPSSPGANFPEPSRRSQTPPKRSSLSRQQTPEPVSPMAAHDPSPNTTPTQKSYDAREPSPNSDYDDRSRPLRDNMRPEPLRLRKSSPAPPNSTPYREDGAPPPPVHRNLDPQSPKPPKSSKPPVDLKSSGVKRRTSSPLKREYLPSDDSSVTASSYNSEDDDSDYTSSEDEFDDYDVPQTELGVSIKDQESPTARAPVPAAVESVLSDSVCSLTPSNSASQAGLHGHQSATATPEGFTKYIATLSHWADKHGTWKDISGDACSILVGPGVIEAYVLSGATENEMNRPLIALDLTPLVLLRQSTVVDLEIRSAVRDGSIMKNIGGGNFRFRCMSSAECYNLYMAVHSARLNNQKFIQLENEARFKNFGERPAPDDNDATSSSRRRSWFGRKNSYRASTRAPAQSQDGASAAPSSSVSASSLFKRLTGGGNLSFNIARSSVGKQQGGAVGSGENSMYGSSSSSSGANSPRAPSMYSSARTNNGEPLSSDNIRIRLHLLVSATKWEDYGNCVLQIRRPPPGWHQELRANHGLEKRITVTTMPRRDSEKPKIVLDAVLGSGCFTPMGSRGIICGVWEGLKGENGEPGIAPATGVAAGSIKKWCFQCASVGEANWVLRLVHQEVMGGLDG